MLPKKKKPTVTVVENKEKGNKKKTRRVVRNTAQDTIPYLEQYENGLYFSKVFHRIKGKTPTDYAREAREKAKRGGK